MAAFKINLDHYERMYHALKTIANGYQTPDQLRKGCKGQYGLAYQETLEMAYENIQQLAKEASKGVRLPKKEIIVIGKTPFDEFLDQK